MRFTNEKITLSSKNEYISFRDLLFHLSSSNDKPLYEVINFLLAQDLDSLKVEKLEKSILNKGKSNYNNRLMACPPREYGAFSNFLLDIKNIIIFPDQTWVFNDIKDFRTLVSTDKTHLVSIINRYSSFGLRVAELLSFDPLEVLLHFDNKTALDKNNKPMSSEQQLLDAKLEIERLKQFNPSNLSMNGKPTIGHTLPKNIKLTEELAIANAKINQQEQDINRLNDQLNNQANGPTNTNEKEGQGDSLLILGAVMHCIQDAAKKNYTQELLIQVILEKYKSVSGISESTLKKKLPESKKYLNQKLTT